MIMNLKCIQLFSYNHTYKDIYEDSKPNSAEVPKSG